MSLELAIAIAVACVLVSALCCGTEVALFSLRRVDRDQLARSTAGGDRAIVRMLERPRRLIATVVIGNEAAAAALAAIAFDVLLRWWSPWPAAGLALAIALPVAVLVMEVTAKTLAAKSPLGWSRACAPLLRGFALLVTPVRLLVGVVTWLLLKPLGDAGRSRPVRDLSEEEFRKLVDAGSAQGQVDARERRLIHRVFEFSDKNVGQVMTPRDRIYALSFDLPMQRIAREIAARGFSRVPIYQKSLDNVRGIVNAKDLVRAATGQGRAKMLGEMLHEPLFVPRTTPVKRLFLTFKTKKVHMAIVVSEYGKVLGLVTMDDLLAQIFGVMRDERAELQNSVAPGRRSAKPITPANGTVRAQSEPGIPQAIEPAHRNGSRAESPLPTALVPAGDATGPVRLEDVSGPIPRIDVHEEVKLSELAEASAQADKLPVGLRPSAEHAIPIFPTDEVTPPAITAEELAEEAAAREERKSRP